MMRTQIMEPGSQRFQIAKEGLPLSEETLRSVPELSNWVTVDDTSMLLGPFESDDQTESTSYLMQFDHWTTYQYTNDKLSMIINPIESLSFEIEQTASNLKRIGA